MSPKPLVSWSFVVASVLIGAGCGGGDSDPSPAPDATADDAADDAASDDATPDESPTDEPDADQDADQVGDDGAAGFGELMEGTFILTGAEDEQWFVSDDELAFRLGGGCADGNFGFSIAITDAAVETTFGMFTAELEDDLSGGVTGEFDAVHAEVTVIPGGDFSASERYEGPIRMVISEHDTGGATADLNARRMSVTLLGTLPGDTGEVDVDVTFRWVMGCP